VGATKKIAGTDNQYNQYQKNSITKQFHKKYFKMSNDLRIDVAKLSPGITTFYDVYQNIE